MIIDLTWTPKIIVILPYFRKTSRTAESRGLELADAAEITSPLAAEGSDVGAHSLSKVIRE
jgi:hypothetical protein